MELGVRDRVDQGLRRRHAIRRHHLVRRQHIAPPRDDERGVELERAESAGHRHRRQLVIAVKATSSS